MKRDFLRVIDFTVDELESILQKAADFKNSFDPGYSALIGKNIGLLFEKPPTKMAASFEAGINHLWGRPVYIDSKTIFQGKGSLLESAKVLSRYINCMIMSAISHSTVEEFARHASIPVINANTDLHHPCQALADLLTIFEKKGRFSLRLAYIGEGNNIAHSLIEGAARVGMDISLACPAGHEPFYEIIQEARREGRSLIEVVREPSAAAKDADVLYTSVMSKPYGKNLYQINSSLLKLARPDAIVMHCLPAHRGEEITDEVIDGPHSVVFDQAENRLHAQKALLEMLIK
ncbi:MAG: ornithine carbamoyltransferase [Nitrospirae bacterium]|nr:ornithine carbamoyltransferase [Nitrospirota bacterium]